MEKREAINSSRAHASMFWGYIALDGDEYETWFYKYKQTKKDFHSIKS